MSHTPPVVMVFAGSDPTGGAGIVADALTLASLGCHPVVVVTAVTAQDTAGVKRFDAVDTDLVVAQARAVLEDMPVAAFKTGMLGNISNLIAIGDIVEDYPEIPLIVDPIQVSGGGDALAEEPLDEVYRSLLVPQATLVTPNTLEARALVPSADTLDACAQGLMSLGCEFVLLTGTHEKTPDVTHHLFGNSRLLESFTFARLQGSYHGSGCTLASACAATLAHGLEPVNAVSEALEYTWQTLKHGFRPGMGQLLPDRLYWSSEEEEDFTTDDE